MADEKTDAAQTPAGSEGTATATAPRLADRERDADMATRPKHRQPADQIDQPPVPMAMRKAGYEYPHIEVGGKIHQNQLVTAMVRVEENGLMFRLQYTAAEDLEPAKPLELVPGTGQLLRMKREKTEGA